MNFEGSVQGCEHDLRKGIEVLAKLVFSFSIKVFNMMKLLVILFIMKLIAQINAFEFVKFPLSSHTFGAISSAIKLWVKKVLNEPLTVQIQ